MRATSITVVLAVLLGACGEATTERPSSTYEDTARGYSVSIPDGWHRAGRNLTPTITDPVEMLTVATFPLRDGEELCGALARAKPDGALVTVQERGRGSYGASDFPERPARFEPEPADEGHSTWPHCGVQDGEPPIPMVHYWFGFSDAGRAFHVLVALGEEAPDEVKRDAFTILDSLELDPDVTPDWPSSEPYTHEDRKLGVSAAIPPGWRRARSVVDSQVTNPRELLVVTTFDIDGAGRECGPFYDHILDRMGSGDALVAVRERLGSSAAGPPEYPARPEHFRLEPAKPQRAGCGWGSHPLVHLWWIPFSDAGRDFYAQVDMGLEAPDSLRRDAEALIDSLRVEP